MTLRPMYRKCPRCKKHTPGIQMWGKCFVQDVVRFHIMNSRKLERSCQLNSGNAL